MRLRGAKAVDSPPPIRPDQVIEDSRRPADTRCIWARQVVIRATLFAGSRRREMELVLGQPVQVATARSASSR